MILGEDLRMKYQKEALKEILFPLGGIGTGSVSLAGNGRLSDWEIFNRPAKGSGNGFSHFAIRAVDDAGKVNARVLQGDHTKDIMGQYVKKPFAGYGYGPANTTMAGFPHFRDVTFTGEFPMASLSLKDDGFPGEATLCAFNPLIPLNPDDSSLPAAFFEWEIKNTGEKPYTYSVAFSVMNPFAATGNEAKNHDGISMIQMIHSGKDRDDLTYGDLTIATDETKGVSLQPYWYRGGWNDGIVTFWNEFSSGKELSPRLYEEPGEKDTASLMVSFRLAPGEGKCVRFLLSWNVPNNYNYWKPFRDDAGRDVTWKNYYATRFKTSADTARYAMNAWGRLMRETMEFHDALFSSTLPPEVIDAAASTLSVLKTPTALRLEDGAFYGWEGVHEEEGSCEGTCQHVWNYAYAMCFLFPDLERSIREQEFQYSTNEDGEMQFRMALPRGRNEEHFRACLDGQMGSVIKTYREWKLSGDNAWLHKMWPSVKKVLAFAWSDKNPDEWDRDKDGVLEGRQHHTLDMELFGPSSWLQSMYLAALKAAEHMAVYLGDSEAATEYGTLFQKGYAWTKEHLFNGKYFIQVSDLKDKRILEHFEAMGYWNEEAGEMKYQIGDGCEIDQMLGQWHADLLGLGSVLDSLQVHTALPNVYKNNFKPSMREFTNPWRIFALNDESGTVICDYPEGTKKPVIPIPYCEESMHGFEYALAGLLVSRGFTEEGLSIVRSVRARYNGVVRNPFNEIECGSNYARSMASFALIPILSGFTFDLPHARIGFAPKVGKPFQSFWGVGTGWGTVQITKEETAICLKAGSVKLQGVFLPYFDRIDAVTVDGEEIPAVFKDGFVQFPEIKKVNRSIVVKGSVK